MSLVGSTSWSDLNKDGKRLESIIKQMNTLQKKSMNNPDLQFAYIDRLLKATSVKIHVAETVLNVKAILQQAKKAGLVTTHTEEELLIAT